MVDSGEQFERAVRAAVEAALSEDLGLGGDVTSEALIPEGLEARGEFVYREPAVVAGVDVVEEVCSQVSAALFLEVSKRDGDLVRAGETALEVEGPARAILAAERTALNFLSRLSGIATLTRRYVDEVEGTPAEVLDTRKTTPGLRLLEKYAVRCGGGTNHRMGLFDQVLVKDNHLALMRRGGESDDLEAALARAREAAPQGAPVEVEARTLSEVEEALSAGADVIMLDNMDAVTMREAVARVHARGGEGRPLLEASGGITLENVREVAGAGVDRISVGALTHSARAIDISLEVR